MKKIKRWLWLYKSENAWILSRVFATEAEAKAFFEPKGLPYEKVTWSETQVEE